MNLAAIIDPHPDDAVALLSRGRTTTYGELREQVAAMRGGLVARGLRKAFEVDEDDAYTVAGVTRPADGLAAERAPIRA